MKQVLLLSISILLLSALNAQVAINSNGSNPNSSAMLDVSSNNKGVLISRMTSAQRTAIASPAVGLLVYDTDKHTIYMFDGVAWQPLAFTSENGLNPIQRKSSNPDPFSEFGNAVAIHNNTAVVGAPKDTAGGVKGGAAYIFVKENGTWKQHQRIYSLNTAEGDMFGASVDIYNDRIVVGAPNKVTSNVEKGRIVVFDKQGDNWVQVTAPIATNGAENDLFGTSVAIDNNTIAVGSPRTDYSSHGDVGSVYIFKLINNFWQQTAIINSPSLVDEQWFGFDVDLQANNLLVGAPGEVNGQVGFGFVYLYNNADNGGVNWAIAKTFVAEGGPTYNPITGMNFGHSVALSSTSILIGAPNWAYNSGMSQGSVYRYTKNGASWLRSALLWSEEEFERQGFSVALDGDVAYIGCRNWSDGKGRVLIYDGTMRYVYNVDPAVTPGFGISLAVHNGQYIIGASLGKAPSANFGSY